MVHKTPINCPHCKKDTGYYVEDFMFMVIIEDVKCPYCDEVLIRVQKAMWNHTGSSLPQSWGI